MVGAPDDLQRRGTPATPIALEAPDCVHYRGVGTHWRLVTLAGEAWRSEPAPICVLFPSGRHLPSCVRVFIDAMVGVFAKDVRDPWIARLI